jgi:hypothetical protein
MNIQIPRRSAFRSIVSIDMVGYELIARPLEEVSGTASTTVEINAQIHALIHQALGQNASTEHLRRLKMKPTSIADTGDGGILMFEDTHDAIAFSENLHQLADERNNATTTDLAKWHFRVGLAVGEVQVRVEPDGTNRFGGTVIARAVRLQSAAKSASTMIDQYASRELSPSEQNRWTRHEFKTKHGESIVGFIRQGYKIPEYASTPGLTRNVHIKDRVVLVKRLENLVPTSQLEKLMYVSGMPLELQPSTALNHQERVLAFVKWLLGPTGPGIDGLDGLL